MHNPAVKAMPKAPAPVRAHKEKSEETQNMSASLPREAQVRKPAVKAMPKAPGQGGRHEKNESQDIVLLSMFDGIGAAETAMRALGKAPVYRRQTRRASRW